MRVIKSKHYSKADDCIISVVDQDIENLAQLSTVFMSGKELCRNIMQCLQPWWSVISIWKRNMIQSFESDVVAEIYFERKRQSERLQEASSLLGK